jgi:hypothetical protein
MLGGLKKWFKQGMAYRNIDKPPAAMTAAHVLSTKWLDCPEMTKDFSSEFVQSEATKILQEVMRILASDNPRMENRQALAGLVVQYARLQVLVMDPDPIEDPTGFRGQPGLTGAMKARIPEIASLDPWLREFLHGFDIHTFDDQWNMVLLRYRQAWIWSEVLNAVRFDLDDYNRAVTKDWYQPFIAAMAAAYEHDCRKALGLPSALDDSDGMADLRARMMSTFLNRVLEGHTYPDLVWSDSMAEVFRHDAAEAHQ